MGRANRVAQTNKEIPKPTQMGWGTAAPARISSQPLCILGTEQDVPNFFGKIIKEQL